MDTSMDVSVETEFPADASSPVAHSTVRTGAFVEMELSTEDPNRSSTRSSSSARLPPYYPKPRPTPPSRPPRSADFVPISTPVDSLTPDRPPVFQMPQHGPISEEVEMMGEAVYKPTTTSAPRVGFLGQEDKHTYDKMYDIYKESHGTSDYFRNLRILIRDMGSPWLWFGIYCFLAIFPFMMVVVGAINHRNCTVEPMIPVYLIVAGVFWLLKISMHIYEVLLSACAEPNGQRPAFVSSLVWRSVLTLFGVFLFCWLIAGCVWVYKVFRPFEHVDPAHPLFCDAYLYNVAFWSVTMQLIGIGVMFVGTFLFMSGLMVRQSRETTAEDP